jgi:sortase B
MSIAVLVFLFSAYKLGAYWLAAKQSSDLNRRLAASAVRIDKTTGDNTAVTENEKETEAASIPITVNFEALWEENPDIVAWLYSPDTPINEPVVQTTDNDYYLHRLPDGSTNAAGTLFMDYRCTSDFSDENCIIYGHNMKNNSMFGTLDLYKEQDYYESHPLLYLITPKASYIVELFAGYVTDTDSEIYVSGQTPEELATLFSQARERSTFTSDVRWEEGEQVLTLSTCSYEYANARFVLLGVLKK